MSRMNSVLVIPLKLRKQQPLLLRSLLLTVIHHLTMPWTASRRVRHRIHILLDIDGLYAGLNEHVQ
jgi:hypothetical protein